MPPNITKKHFIEPNEIKNNPDDVEVLKTLASIYHALRENDKAIEIYEKLTKLQPNEIEISNYNVNYRM